MLERTINDNCPTTNGEPRIQKCVFVFRTRYYKICLNTISFCTWDIKPEKLFFKKNVVTLITLEIQK